MPQDYAGGFTIEPEFSVSSTLNRSFETLKAKPFLFIGLTATAALPGLCVLMFLMTPLVNYPYAMRSHFMMASFSAAFVSIFFGLIVQAAIAYGVYRTLTGEAASYFGCLWRGFSRGFSLVFAVMCAMLCLWIGFMMLVIPGVILITMMFVAIPACAVEKLGPVGCLNRSAELTKGHRLKVLGLIVLYVLASSGIDYSFAFLMGLVSDSLLVRSLAGAVISILPSAFLGIMVGVAYFDLRAVKEGTGIEGLANVFD